MVQANCIHARPRQGAPATQHAGRRAFHGDTTPPGAQEQKWKVARGGDGKSPADHFVDIERFHEQPEQDRACVLAALESVSLVTLFDEATPLELLKIVRPELYVKGGDYDIESLAETALVRGWGGDARALPFVDGYSTTALVTRIRG